MKLFQRIGNWIKSTFADVADLIEERAQDAVILTQIIKTAIEKHEGGLDFVFSELKLRKLDRLHSFAKAKLPDLIKELSTIDDLVGAEASKEAAWDAYTAYISDKMKDARVKEWVNLSAKILGAFMFKKPPHGVLVAATQLAYHILFGKK